MSVETLKSVHTAAELLHWTREWVRDLLAPWVRARDNVE